MSNPMTPKYIQAYHQELNLALEKFQYIEDILKACLLTAIDIVRINVSAYFPLRVTSEDVSVFPLGPLIKNFSIICDDSILINDLGAIKDGRNHIAHTSTLFTIGELHDKKHMAKVTLEMKEIAERAANLHERVLKVRHDLIREKTKAKRASVASPTIL